MDTIKLCRKCGQLRPTSEFKRDSHRPDGLYIWCRQCDHAYSLKLRESRKKSPLSGDRACRDCGQIKPLTEFPYHSRQCKSCLNVYLKAVRRTDVPWPPDEATIKRFWSHVDTSGDCWIWTGAKYHHGHGAFQLGGLRGKPIKASRFSYELEYGLVSSDKVVRHMCGNSSCVRPARPILEEQDRLSNELSGMGATWFEPESTEHEHTLGEYAVTDIESDTNATIVDRVGDGEDDEEPLTYPSEREALLGAIRANRRLLEAAKKDPSAYVYVPWDDEWL